MVLSPNDVLAALRSLATVDDESVVVTSIPLHVLNGLLEFLVVVKP